MVEAGPDRALVRNGEVRRLFLRDGEPGQRRRRTEQFGGPGPGGDHGLPCRQYLGASAVVDGEPDAVWHVQHLLVEPDAAPAFGGFRVGRGRCQARSRATQIMAGTATMVVMSTVSFATVRPVW